MSGIGEIVEILMPVRNPIEIKQVSTDQHLDQTAKNEAQSGLCNNSVRRCIKVLGMLLLRYIALLSGLDAQTTPTFSPPGGGSERRWPGAG